MTPPPSAGDAPAGGSLPRRFVVAVGRAVDLIGRAAAWLTLIIVVLMAANVLLRYVFSIGSVWSQELEWHLLAPLVLFGMTYALMRGEHVRVDVLYARYSPRGQAAVDLLSALLAVAVSLLVIRYSIGYVEQSYSIDEISADPGGLTHRWMLKALIPVGFAVFALQACALGVDAALRLFEAPARSGESGERPAR
jgi:TRAP-type mannitol/chloroaromatic compound transport system permease small subunit